MYIRKDNNHRIFDELSSIFDLPNNQLYTTEKLRDYINSYLNECQDQRRFTENLQHDASEYLQCLLEAMSNENGQETRAGDTYFEGYYQNIIECSCGHRRETGTETMPLLFPITLNEQDLQSCVNNLFIPEVIPMKCEQCSKPSTSKQLRILSVPNILILLVKRYVFDTATKLTLKINAPLSCPQKLVLPCGTLLNHLSTINHYGDNPKVGHYTTLLRDRKKEDLYHCDDTNITILEQIPEEMDRSNYIIV